MKKCLCLPTCFFLISFLFCQLPLFTQLQLTDQQKAGVETYILKNPVLAKYSNDVRDKVLNNQENIANIINCWENIKRYADLENIRNMEDLSAMYFQLGQKDLELRNKFLPNFNREEYKNAMQVLPGNKININATMHSSLLKRYYSGRKDKLNSKNAFGSMIIQYPELVEELRKAAKASLNKAVDDASLNLWLEMNYFQQMRLDAIKQMADAGKDDYFFIEKGCLSHFPQQFEDLAKNTNFTPKDWTGFFVNEMFALTIELRGGNFILGKHSGSVGMASENGQWKLVVNGSKATGTWTNLVTYDDKIITRTGDITATLSENNLKYEIKYDIIEGTAEVNWKAGVKPYPIGNFNGVNWFGTLKKQN